jgi:LPS sulfotransferase NodH
MTRRFDAFVIFAEMRTGSNHLEESLNALDDVQCHGELFNPTFIGQHNRFEFLGFDLHRRERDPVGMVDTMIDRGGTLPGFRFFHDHDARVLDRVLPDPRIAKVLLTRNPLDSYVSRKIASETGQWRLTDLKHAKSRKVTFDEREFARMLTDWTAFRSVLRRDLQVTGQAMFHIRYEDINDADILNGLAAFLGSAHRLPAASDRLKRQNPGAIEDKIANVSEMTAALARIDRFGLDRVTDGEVPRPPGVSGFVAHPETKLLFMPIAGAPIDPVLDWMAGIGDVGREALVSGMTQKDLRKWMRTHPGFVSFSILRHPMLRVIDAYQELREAEDVRATELREVLTQRYGVPFDDAVTVPGLMSFAAFLQGSLKGQTSLKAPPNWATQASLLQAAADVVLPQRILRERDASQGLAQIAGTLGVAAADYIHPRPHDPSMADVMADDAVQKAIFDAYRKDFVLYGFSRSDVA